MNMGTCYHYISFNIVRKYFGEIFVSMVKSLFQNLAFNLSLEKGVFPDNLKIAKATPLFKVGDTVLLSNHRSIFVLSCFSKMLERIINFTPGIKAKFKEFSGEI